MNQVIVTCGDADDRRISQRFIDQMFAGQAHAAFDEIEKRASSTCRSACHSAGIRKPEDQEDVAQNAMIELFHTAWKRYDGTCSIFTYLYTIAFRRALDLVRKRSKQLDPITEVKVAASSKDAKDSPRDAFDADNEVNPKVIGADHRLCASMALEELQVKRPQWLEILSAWILSGETVESLAESMGLAAGSLRNLITRIKLYLSELCHKHCGTSDCSAAVAS